MNDSYLKKSNINNSWKAILLKWSKELKIKLDNKENENIDIFLIDKDFIDKQCFKKPFNHSNNLKKEINEKSKFYILNENCWNSLLGEKFNELKVIYEGHFLNKILLFTNEQIYFFLFLDEKKEIKKGFFQASNEINNIKDIIINFFEENEPLKKDEFFDKYGIKYKILEDNSIFENKKKNGEIIKGKTIHYYKPILKYHYFLNKSTIKNKLINTKNSFYLKDNNFQSGENGRVWNNNLKGNEIQANLNKRDNDVYISKIYKYKYKKGNDQYNRISIKRLVKKRPQEKEKDNQNKNVVEINLMNLKDIFDPKTKIVKRIPSVQNKKNFKANNILRNKANNIKANIEDFLPKKALHRLATPGVIGLSKIGNIPFVNAIIQCFSNIPRFKYELLKKEIYDDLEENKLNYKKLSFALAEVLKNLWENLSLLVYKPNNFINVLNEEKPDIDHAFYEPRDLIEFLLKEIHYELNAPQNIRIEINKDSNIFQNNALIKVFNNYKKNYENVHNSIITKEFNGYYIDLQGCFICNNYHINISNINNFRFLNFSLEEIKHFKNYNFNCVNIYDCFEYFEKMQQHSFVCNKCGMQMGKSSRILNLPCTLIINFEYKENMIKVIYEEFLILKKYLRINNNSNSPFYYELIGAICRVNSNNENNYVAFCKNENCDWYKYNDNKVTKSSFGEIEGFPCSLFFSYIQV